MPYDTLPPAAAHRVELDGRERLIVSGVDDVDRFDENEIVMTTSDGRIDSLLYEDADRPSGGLLSRLFGG